MRLPSSALPLLQVFYIKLVRDDAEAAVASSNSQIIAVMDVLNFETEMRVLLT